MEAFVPNSLAKFISDLFSAAAALDPIGLPGPVARRFTANINGPSIHARLPQINMMLTSIAVFIKTARYMPLYEQRVFKQIIRAFRYNLHYNGSAVIDIP